MGWRKSWCNQGTNRAFGRCYCVSLSVNRSSYDNKTDVLDVLVCFEVELGRKALTAVGADNGAGG